MRRYKRASLLLPTLLVALVLPLNALAAEAAPAEGTPKAPVPVPEKHMLSARVSWAPFYAVSIDTNYEPFAGFILANLGIGAEYVYNLGRVRIGGAIEYSFADFEKKTDLQNLSIPFVLMVQQKLSGESALGFTFSAGFFLSVSKLLGNCGGCDRHEPSYGGMIEPFLFYSPSPGVSFGGGLNMAITSEGPGEDRIILSVPLRLSLRKQW